jgi:dTDP-4-amino-4,6-dideoxygalactose transaminase
LRDWNEQRNQVAKWYTQAFKNVPGIIAPNVMLRTTHVWHQYTLRVQVQENPGEPSFRDQLIKQLAERGIGSMCYYPVPLHMQTAFAGAGYKKGDLPISETLAREVISLPMYPELEEHQCKQVAYAINEIMTARLTTVAPVAPVVTSF